MVKGTHTYLLYTYIAFLSIAGEKRLVLSAISYIQCVYFNNNITNALLYKSTVCHILSSIYKTYQKSWFLRRFLHRPDWYYIFYSITLGRLQKMRLLSRGLLWLSRYSALLAKNIHMWSGQNNSPIVEFPSTLCQIQYILDILFISCVFWLFLLYSLPR